MHSATASKNRVTRRRTTSGSDPATNSVDATRSTKSTVASLRSMRLSLWSGRAAPKAALPFFHLRRLDLCDDLLLVIDGICAVIEGRDRRRVDITGRGRIDPEVVAYEPARTGDRARTGRRELRIPRVSGQPNVLSGWAAGGCVELDRSIDAVVR